MAKLLDFMVRCANASEDEAADDLLRMAEPGSFDSRAEMEDHFEDCLGYNPLNYFDRKTLEEEFSNIVSDAPYSVREQLNAKKEEIIDRTLASLDEVDDAVLLSVFTNVIRDTVGWAPPDDGNASLDAVVSMAVFGDGVEPYDDEDAADEDDEDYDEDDDDEDDSDDEDE